MSEELEDGSLARIPFSIREEESIATMALWMKIAGVCSIIVALGEFAMMATGKKANVISGILGGIMGAWLLQASQAFHRVATTDDADQKYLAQGFDELRKVFLMKSVLLILVVGIMVVGLFVVMTVGVSKFR